jgi:ketosteroid isomerase-like protein
VTKSNAELVVEALAAYQQGQDETVRGLMHPDVEIYSEPGMINAGTFHGFDGFKAWTRQWEEAWQEITYEPVEFIEVDESLLVVAVRVTGKGAGSGLEIDRTFSYLYEIKAGRATRLHLYDNADKALEAARAIQAGRE